MSDKWADVNDNQTAMKRLRAARPRSGQAGAHPAESRD